MIPSIPRSDTRNIFHFGLELISKQRLIFEALFITHSITTGYNLQTKGPDGVPLLPRQTHEKYGTFGTYSRHLSDISDISNPPMILRCTQKFLNFLGASKKQPGGQEFYPRADSLLSEYGITNDLRKKSLIMEVERK